MQLTGKAGGGILCGSRSSPAAGSELLQQPAEFRARVIVEELLHLKVPNHGKLFKALLKSYLAERSRTESQDAGRGTRQRRA